MRRTELLLMTLLLGACQAGGQRYEDPAYYVLSPGATLTLHEPLTIAPDALAVRIQDGRVQRAVNQYYPSCKFSLRDLSERRRQVQPGTFLISRITRGENYVARERILTAGIGFGFGMFGDAASLTAVEMVTVFHLYSEQQPEVFRLECSHWDEPSYPRHLTLSQIRTALGEVFSLEPAGARPAPER